MYKSLPANDRLYAGMGPCIRTPCNAFLKRSTYAFNKSLRAISPRYLCESKARWVYPLTDPRPLWQLYQRHQSAMISLNLFNRIPPLNMVYLL